MNRHPSERPTGRGFMLIEVLVALLIFAIGVLGLVGLQVIAIQQSGLARSRSDAALLADDLIGRMWVSDHAALSQDFSSAAGGTPYLEWQSQVNAALPGAAEHPPLVSIDEVAPLPAGSLPLAAADLTPSKLVTITLRWKATSDPPADPPHQLVVVTGFK